MSSGWETLILFFFPNSSVLFIPNHPKIIRHGLSRHRVQVHNHMSHNGFLGGGQGCTRFWNANDKINLSVTLHSDEAMLHNHQSSHSWSQYDLIVILLLRGCVSYSRDSFGFPRLVDRCTCPVVHNK